MFYFLNWSTPRIYNDMIILVYLTIFLHFVLLKRFKIDSRTWCQVAQECFRQRGTRLQWGTLIIPVSGPNGLGWLLNIKPGQKAWGEDSNILDSCDGQVISNININVDLDVIKYQCSCSFTNVFSVEKLYMPCRNPGVDHCKNRYKLTRSMVNNTEFLVLPHQHHWFLLHIFNFSKVDVSNKVIGSSQSISLSSSPSKANITPTTYHDLTQSFPTISTQRSINQKDNKKRTGQVNPRVDRKYLSFEERRKATRRSS